MEFNPDYCAALYHDTEWAYDGPAEDDSLEFYDLDGNLLCKIVVPGIYKWCCDWEELMMLIASMVKLISTGIHGEYRACN